MFGQWCQYGVVTNSTMPVKLWTFSPPPHRGRDRSVKRNICHFRFHWRKKNRMKLSVGKKQQFSQFYFYCSMQSMLKSHSKYINYCTNKQNFKKRQKLTQDSIILKQPLFLHVLFLSCLICRHNSCLKKSQHTFLPFYIHHIMEVII